VKPIVHFRTDAETDVADAAAWYEIQRSGLGAEFLDEILTTCSSIAAIHKHTHSFTEKLEEQLSINSRLEYITESKMG